MRTEPAALLPLRPRRWYRVRHRACFGAEAITASFRVWPADMPEPADWLCEETAPRAKMPFEAASFGLFQHSGFPSEWRDIRLEVLHEPYGREG